MKWNAFFQMLRYLNIEIQQKVQSCKQKIDSCSKKEGKRMFTLHLFLLTDRSNQRGHFAQYFATKNKIFAFYKYVRSLREFDPILHNRMSRECFVEHCYPMSTNTSPPFWVITPYNKATLETSNENATFTP